VQRGLARSPGLTKVVRPDSVGRRLNVSFYCPRMLLIVEIEMVWRRSETELGRGLARSPGLNKVVRPDSVGRRLNVSFHLFAAGATPIVIRTMGRWSSDCCRLYVRACYEQTLYWSSKCGSTPVRDLAGQWCDEVSYY
jgi:hypothetical protein